MRWLPATELTLKKHSSYAYAFLIVLLHSWHSLHTHTNKQTSTFAQLNTTIIVLFFPLAFSRRWRLSSPLRAVQSTYFVVVAVFFVVRLNLHESICCCCCFLLSRWDAYLVDGAGLCNIKSYTYSQRNWLEVSHSLDTHSCILHLDLAAAAAAAAFFSEFFNFQILNSFHLVLFIYLSFVCALVFSSLLTELRHVEISSVFPSFFKQKKY